MRYKKIKCVSCIYILPEEALSCNNISQWLTLRWDWQNPRRVSFVLFQPFPKQGGWNPFPSLLVTLSTVKNMCPAWTASTPHLYSHITSPLNIHNYPSTPCEIRCLMFNYAGYKLQEADCDSVSTHPVPYAVRTESGHNKNCLSLCHERLDSAFRGCVISLQTLSVPPWLMKPTVGSCCLRI